MADTPDQPDGIDEQSRDLPDPARAAERVAEFQAWYGDGRIYIDHVDDEGSLGPPLYSRDLEALRRAAAVRGETHTTSGACVEGDGWPRWLVKGARPDAECGPTISLRYGDGDYTPGQARALADALKQNADYVETPTPAEPLPDAHGVWEGHVGPIEGYVRGPLAGGVGDADVVLLATCPDAATAERIVEALSAADAAAEGGGRRG